MKATTSTPRTRAKSSKSSRETPQEQRQEMIATAAYFRAEQRGFTGGTELDDWLAAEAEINDRLSVRQ
jgi:hypothetical protein